MSNIIDDVLEWSPTLALSGMMEKQQPVVNFTGPGSSANGTKASEETTASDGLGDVNQAEGEVVEDVNESDANQHH